MRNSKEWGSFKITLLLYVIVAIIPLTFYFVYSSFNSSKDDTKVIHNVGWIKGALETHMSHNPSDPSRAIIMTGIDKKLDKISAWVERNNDSKFYLGGKTLKEDFLYVKSCWSEYKQKVSQHYNKSTVASQNIKCTNTLKNLTVIIENMVYLKENGMLNIFYQSLAVAMILSLFLIYMVRAYVQVQIAKNAIYDMDTKLFNKEYFLSSLKIAHANSVRNNYPLSLISINIDSLKEKMQTPYDKKSEKHLLRIFGALLNSTVRDCDIACRYDNWQFFILLPSTQKEEASFLEKRIYKLIEEHDFEVTPKPEFDFKVEEYNCSKGFELFRKEVLKEF